MTQTIAAVYENGVLRPLEPLFLLEQQQVKLQVITEDIVDETKQVIQNLIKTGLLTPPLGYSEVEPLSEKEHNKLATILGNAAPKPLSEIIIEERGEW